MESRRLSTRHGWIPPSGTSDAPDSVLALIQGAFVLVPSSRDPAALRSVGTSIVDLVGVRPTAAMPAGVTP